MTPDESTAGAIGHPSTMAPSVHSPPVTIPDSVLPQVPVEHAEPVTPAELSPQLLQPSPTVPARPPLEPHPESQPQSAEAVPDEHPELPDEQPFQAEEPQLEQESPKPEVQPQVDAVDQAREPRHILQPLQLDADQLRFELQAPLFEKQLLAKRPSAQSDGPQDPDPHQLPDVQLDKPHWEQPNASVGVPNVIVSMSTMEMNRNQTEFVGMEGTPGSTCRYVCCGETPPILTVFAMLLRQKTSGN